MWVIRVTLTVLGHFGSTRQEDVLGARQHVSKVSKVDLADVVILNEQMEIMPGAAE